MGMKIGVLGTGMVGVTLADGLKSLGYDVTIGSRVVKKVDGWDGPVDTFDNVAKSADLLVLSVKGTVAEELVKKIKDRLSGKTVIDTTNPIADGPPENGVTRYFTDINESLMERLQKDAPDAHFVKAFNSVGNSTMVNPGFGDTKPSMFICGDDLSSKLEVTEILNKFGWEVEDFGAVEAARPIESLCMLWCVPAITGTSYNHVFKLLKKK